MNRTLFNGLIILLIGLYFSMQNSRTSIFFFYNAEYAIYGDLCNLDYENTHAHGILIQMQR